MSLSNKLQHLYITQNQSLDYLVDKIDKEYDNFDINAWLLSMYNCINEKEANDICLSDDELSEAYFYYGVISYSNKGKSQDDLGLNLDSKVAFDFVKQYNNPKEVWKLQVIKPLIKENGWLNILLKSGLTRLLDELYNDSLEWSSKCTPDHKFIFNCFNFDYNKLKAIVFGESTTSVSNKYFKYYENSGFAFQQKLINSVACKVLPPAIDNILKALMAKYINNWDNILNTNSIHKRIKDLIIRSVIKSGLDIEDFSRRNHYLFLNIRLTNFELIYFDANDKKYYYNKHRDLWDNFFTKVFEYIFKDNRNQRLTVYQIFYSPERSIQTVHKIRDLLNSSMYIIDNVDIVPDANYCYISCLSEKQVDSLISVFNKHPIFYELIASHLLSAIIEIYNQESDENNIFELNQLLLIYFENLNESYKFNEDLLREIVSKHDINTNNKLLDIKNYLLCDCEKPEYLKYGFIKPAGHEFFISDDREETIIIDNDINCDNDNYIRIGFTSKNLVKVNSIDVEVKTKKEDDKFKYRLTLYGTGQNMIINKYDHLNIKKYSFMVNNEISGIKLEETTQNEVIVTNITSYKIMFKFDIKEFLQKSYIMPDLIEDSDQRIRVIQVVINDKTHVSLGNRIFVFRNDLKTMSLGKWKQLYNYQTFIMIDADSHLDPKITKVHWLVANMKENEIKAENVIIKYEIPTPPEPKVHRYVIAMYGHYSEIKGFEKIIKNCDEFDLKDYVETNNMIPIYANFFLY